MMIILRCRRHYTRLFKQYPLVCTFSNPNHKLICTNISAQWCKYTVILEKRGLISETAYIKHPFGEYVAHIRSDFFLKDEVRPGRHV